MNKLREINQNEYVLFLADGEYRKEYDIPESRICPYVINDKIDVYKDLSRLRFLSEFLSRFYAFPNGQSSTDDNKQRLHMEMMVYSHIWEAQPFLKRIYRIAHQSIGQRRHGRVIQQVVADFELLQSCVVLQVIRYIGNIAAAKVLSRKNENP